MSTTHPSPRKKIDQLERMCVCERERERERESEREREREREREMCRDFVME